MNSRGVFIRAQSIHFSRYIVKASQTGGASANLRSVSSLATAAARRRSRRAARRPDAGTVARFFHGLSDPTRLEILRFLLDGPKTAGDIVRHVRRPQASVAAHVTCLRFCGYVEASRDGRNVWYALIDPRVRQILSMGERYLTQNAERIRACQVISAERDR